MDSGEATVVVNFGTQALLDTGDGGMLRCTVRGKRLRAVCGDIVHWERVDEHHGVIDRLVRRERTLERADGRGGAQAVASGLDQVLVVVAPEPSPDAVLVDRYLVMVERGGLEAAIVANKSDRAEPEFLDRFAEFANAGYPLLLCSAQSGAGLDDLRARTTGRVTLLVGQSGVGKSSILNALVPDLELQTGTLSVATGEGRHTTTATTRYRLPGGGALVDSPGVREFWLPKMSGAELAAGFREINEVAGTCRFRNCAHLKEPDCAVLSALAAGQISERRYSSYRQLARTITT